MNQSRIVTAPDLDLDHRFKVLLVDVEWGDIERLSNTINNLDIDITLFLYGSNETDDVWCLNAHKHSYATLVNTRFSGNKELLKGYLLAQKNCWGYGSNDIAKYNHRETFDIYSWLIQLHANYIKEENNV
jgi:hypothetical protein